MKQKFDKRIHDLKTQNADIKKFLNHSDAFVESKLNPVISKTSKFYILHLIFFLYIK